MNLLYASAEQKHHFDKVFKRAATDPDFRRRLLSDPKKAFQDSTGVRLPDTYRIKFIETPKGVDALVPLPELIDETVSLTENELEAVAGGADDATWCCADCSECTACSQCSIVTKTTDAGVGVALV